MEDWQVGYLAGMIDAEFYVGIERQWQRHGTTPSYVVRAELSMTNRVPVDFVNALLPNSKVIAVGAQGRRAPYYRLRVRQQQALELLRTALPYVQGKRRQIEICVEIDALRRRLTPDPRHPGQARFQPMPAEFAIQADLLYREFRLLQLNKKPRAHGVWDMPLEDFVRHHARPPA